MKRPLIIGTLFAICFLPTLFPAEPIVPAPKPALWNPTNALSKLPATDRLWLLGEQLKQLIGDWANQQGDIGIDLIFYLEEPVRILTEELKRIDRQHQKDMAALQKDILELRAEIQALKHAQANAQTMPTIVPKPAPTTNVSTPK